MSQVSFYTQVNGRRAQVVGGWDRPLEYYHLTIFDLGDDEEEILFSCLDRPVWKTQDPGEYKTVLDTFGITAPAYFYAICSRREGNTFYFYNEVTEQWES